MVISVLIYSQQILARKYYKKPVSIIEIVQLFNYFFHLIIMFILPNRQVHITDI